MRSMNPEQLERLGQRVERARLSHGWSKEQAAREARISSITWKRVEDGLGVQDVKRAKVLEVSGWTTVVSLSVGPRKMGAS